MVRVLDRPATYDDLVRVPPHMVAEIVDGELYATPRPAAPHAVAASALGMEIGPPYHRGKGGPGGWWIIDEPEVHLGRNIVVPDIAGWRREKMPRPPKNHVFSIAPDWVCEVLSPSTARLDRIRKMPQYAAHGVTWAWLVDPDARTLEVRRLENGVWLDIAGFEGDDKVRIEPFEAIEIDLSTLWVETE